MTEATLKKLIKPGEDQVFLLTCPATLPFGFARHPWFVVNRRETLSRWEVLQTPQRCRTSWGHLHKDLYSPTQGIVKYFFSEKYLWNRSELLGYIEGDVAREMAEFIESSPQSYPFCYRYSLRGPNSNTYVQWVLARFPESKLRLPWNSFGKGSVPSPSLP